MPTSDFYEDDEAYQDLPSLRKLLQSIMPEQQAGPVESRFEPSAFDMADNLGVSPQEFSLPSDQRDQPRPNVSDFTSNMGEKQRLDVNAGRRTGSVNAPQNFTLDDIAKLNLAAEGRTGVPGTQSFMNPGQPGSVRFNEGRTPEGERADNSANSLRSFNKGKYGGSGRYGGGGADVLNPAENIAQLGRDAFASGAAGRRSSEARIRNLEALLQDATFAGNQNSPTAKNLEELLGMVKGANKSQFLADESALFDSAGVAPKILAPLVEMQKEERQRQEYAQLADMLRGKGSSSMSKGFPGGMSKETYGQAGKVLSSQREERRLDNTDRSFAALTENRADVRNDRNNRPITPSAASVKLNMQSYLPPGTSVAKIAGQDILVKSGTSNPVPNGEMYIRQAIQRAQQELSQRNVNPAIAKHPAIQAVTQMLKAEQDGTLAPHQNVLLQRFKQNQLQIKQELMKNGLDERAAAEQANLLAAGDVVGMR